MNDVELMMSGGILKKSVETAKDDERIIKGYCSVPVVDLENEVISTNAYDSAIKVVKERVEKGRPIPMFIEHRRKELSLPIGSVIGAGKDDKGLWFKGKIAKGSIGDSVWDLIKQNILYSVSMGGEALRKHRKFDNKINKDVTVIDDLVFRELSLTGLPVNEEAVFSIAKSLGSKKEKETFSKEAMKSLKKLNAAIDFEKSICDLEKATEEAQDGNEDLSEDQIARIEESMTTLARLLGIKTSFSAEGNEGIVQPGEDTVEPQTTDDLTNETKEITEEPNENQVEETEQLPTEENTQVNQNKNNFKKPVNDAKKQEIDQSELQNEQVKENPEEIKKEPLEEEINDLKTENKDQKKKKKLLKKEDVEMSSPDKALESTNISENTPNTTDEKLDKIIELLKKGGEKSLDIIKCVGCGSNYEKSDYDVNFCPKCGEDLAKCENCKDEDEDDEEGEGDDDDFVKSDDEDEEEVNDEDEEALFCKSCDSVFGKAEDYSMCFCPKCGGDLMKSGDSVAIAASPKGAKTSWGKEPGAKKPTSGDSVAVSKNPSGVDTKWKKSQKRLAVEKNLDVENPAKNGTGESVSAFGDGDFQEANTKTRTDKEDSTLHDWDKKFQPMEGAPKEGIFDTYETDKKGIGKSLEDRLDSIEKALGNIDSKSSGRKSRISNEKVEKSSDTHEEDSNRFLARVFLGKV